MHIIKLDATESTNLYLKNRLLSTPVDDFTVIVANEQLKARGQMGAVWQSSPGKNLTFSVLKRFEGFSVQNQFYINIAVSLAVYAMLKALKTPNLKIKWPNDILSGSGKICGILIENILQGQQIKASVIGIGLNVNQTTFHNLFNATSLKLLLDKNFNLEDLLNELLEKLVHYFDLLILGKFKELEEAYLDVLFMKGKITQFQDKNEKSFYGTISGISSTGKLEVLLKDGPLKEFNLKEIKLIY
ncbi:biotin--[acetyl-CoA-carboxylase] ligase [Aurantibacter crassamenti]|uniref:biotin--[acetyl-CoA-carboxylase] ligase n=1 Tax=Aurantibacter crassamenti TaxID=1837375 RepID=UPI001939DB28|nr:biotin--[acetyl-CoA-carboxylase] ligase [Aurantibacter crassamenti]MBM1108016.1 biotin--[acetyl-CoA-carboxylase] ligase [Aurantibacter crassamenti]